MDTANREVMILMGGHFLSVLEESATKVSVSLDEMSLGLHHEVVGHELKKINTKTVVAALQGQHPKILGATLAKNPDELFVLTITVTYQFLPQIEEQLILSKREFQAEESQQAEARNFNNTIRNLTEQLKTITNNSTLCGAINPIGESFDLHLPMPHEHTLYTCTLTLHKPTSQQIQPQVYLFNSATKIKEITHIIPDEGLFLHHCGEQVTVQLRFIFERSEKFDHAILSLRGPDTGNYLITMQKVTSF